MTSPLRVDGQVSFSVHEGQTHTDGTISGHGNQVRVHAEDPPALMTAMLESHGDRVLPVLAKQLHEHDLQVLVTGPRGAVVTVGAGVDNNLAGRFLLGSRHVRPGRPRALAPVARAVAPGAVTAVASAVGALIVLAIARAYARTRQRSGRAQA